MTKRLATDAKIVLVNAGYIVMESGTFRKPGSLVVYTGDYEKRDTWQEVERIAISGGCVLNEPIERLRNSPNVKNLRTQMF